MKSPIVTRTFYCCENACINYVREIRKAAMTVRDKYYLKITARTELFWRVLIILVRYKYNVKTLYKMRRILYDYTIKSFYYQVVFSYTKTTFNIQKRVNIMCTLTYLCNKNTFKSVALIFNRIESVNFSHFNQLNVNDFTIFKNRTFNSDWTWSMEYVRTEKKHDYCFKIIFFFYFSRFFYRSSGLSYTYRVQCVMNNG